MCENYSQDINKTKEAIKHLAYDLRNAEIGVIIKELQFLTKFHVNRISKAHDMLKEDVKRDLTNV